MAISARNGDTLTIPGEDKPVTLRHTTDGMPPVCNTCGQDAPAHLFRPAIAYRCADCLSRWGKAQTVGTFLTMADGAERWVTDRLSLPGEGHVGPVARIPEP